LAEHTEALPDYLEHILARERLNTGKARALDKEDDLAVLPSEIDKLTVSNPRECLQLVLAALRQPIGPYAVQAVGDELLENLLNQSGRTIASDVAEQLRTNLRFRQAFSCGDYGSVDPDIVMEWVRIFQELGTTKEQERKSLWRVAV
jgi:hypothetical protein